MSASDWIVPGEVGEPEKAKDEKEGEDEDAIDHPFLGRKMHENGGDQTSLEGRDHQRDGNVRLLRSKINVGKKNRDRSESEERGAHHQIRADVFRNIMRGMLIVRLAGRRSRRHRFRERGWLRFVHGSKQIKERENKNPDQIDKVPEQA